MQMSFDFYNRSESFRRIHRRLLRRFGRPGPWRHLDPVSQLIMGIIGGRTLTDDSLRAFKALLRRFDRWEDICNAEPGQVARAIAAVTDAEAKAWRLPAALRQVCARRGRLELDFLGGLPVEAALVWLERLPGVGRKASASTLNFSTLRMRALVIDRHHLRVLRRLGLVRARADGTEAFERVMPDLPPDWTAADVDDHHQLMKTLGQRLCRHDSSRCPACPLQDLCESRAKAFAVSDPGGRFGLQ